MMNKKLLFPLLIVIASSSYGILSTIIKVAMAHGFTTAEAVQSQYACCSGLVFDVQEGTALDCHQE